MPERTEKCPEVVVPGRRNTKFEKAETGIKKTGPIIGVEVGHAHDEFIDEGDPRAAEDLHQKWDGAGLG